MPVEELTIKITGELERNRGVFESLLQNKRKEEFLWRPGPGKWCLLEIVCHLYDEEREDFRARIKHIFENSGGPLPQIDPPGWVESRNYIQQDFDKMLAGFLAERELSINWLRSLNNPEWESYFEHEKFGRMTAKMFLTNWLAHDYLHVRQVTGLQFKYLEYLSGEDLKYAGDW